jgi:hypothetical protein
MRALVTIAHYFKREAALDWSHVLGSGRAPLAKVAGLNAQIVALNRHFGARRLARDAKQSAFYAGSQPNTLDIVIMAVRGAGLLDGIGIDPSAYTVDYFDGPPLMLPFEAQRIMRERAGGYDYYAYMEDDLSVADPAFFDKVGWFAATFGPQAMLVPLRYEMAHSGLPAKVAIEPPLSADLRGALRQGGYARTLKGSWNGREQTFHLPNNPHAGCFAVTDAQLKLWMKQPSFYDRDASWVTPLESAATFAPGRAFGLYRAAEPDPWFLEIEHYGTFYSAALAPPGQTYGEPPLLALAEAMMKGETAAAALARPAATTNMVMSEALQLRHELESLKRSRTRLARAFVESCWRKLTGRE